MNCKCIPRQIEPHIIKSAGIKAYYFFIPTKFSFPRKNFILFSIYKNLKSPISCDGVKLPIKRWQINIGKYSFFIGKKLSTDCV